jgi:hypothetical protein
VKGENELNALPKTAVYGANYTGPKNVVAGLSQTVPTTGVATTSGIGGPLGAPPGGPPGAPPGIGGPAGPYPTLPAPISAADIAAAVTAAVAALPPPPAAPALPAPPTPDEIADAIIASLRTLAAGGFGYMRPGGPYDIRLIMADAARAVHAALPPSPPPPALPAPPTALQIADAIRAAILALPPPPAPVVNVAPPVINYPALPAPPTYPALMPPPAKDIERILKRFLPSGIKSSTRKNISSGIVSSMVSAYSSSIPSSSASRVPPRSASRIASYSSSVPSSSASSVPPYSTDSDSDSESSAGPTLKPPIKPSRGTSGIPNIVPFSTGPPSKPSRKPSSSTSSATATNPSSAAAGLQQKQFTPIEINTIIELSLIHKKSASDIADELLNNSISPHVINVFFTVKKLEIPDKIKIPELINATDDINEYINDNIDETSRDTIYDDLLKDYPQELIRDVFVAREKTLGEIPGASEQKISAQKKSQSTQLEITSNQSPFTKAQTFRNEIANTSNGLVRKCYLGEFYYLLNTLFINSDPYLKRTLRNVLRNSTSVNVKDTGINLSQAAYNESLDNLVIIKNSGGGNCFFIAVAQAINYYNYQNQDTRIIYKRYGVGTNEYTQETIREIIYDYYTNPEPNIQHSLDEFFENAPVHVENLNDIFRRDITALQQHFTDQEQEERVYRETLIDTYKGNQNFLTTSDFLNPNIPIPQRSNPLYFEPYKVLERADLRKYMLSDNYWGGGEAITALCSKHTLKLQVIPLNVQPNCRIINTSNPFDLFENDWTRYLFLYENSSHFELMSFNYLADPSAGGKKIKLKKTIFVRDDNKSIGIPPIYILFTIYGMLYSNLIEDNFNFQKQNFPYNKPLMDAFENTIKQIKSKFSQEDYAKFYTSFMKYFPNSRIPKPTDRGGSKLNDIDVQEGGYTTPYNYNPNRYPSYPNRYPSYPNRYPQYSQYTKNAIKVPDTSQLAYYITIDLQLQPGTSISPEEKKNLNCNHKWNAVRKSYSQLLGKQYNPKPDYSLLAPPKNNNSNSQQMNNKSRRPPINQYDTRRYRENPLNYGGKKRKTMKRKNIKTRKIVNRRKHIKTRKQIK